MTVTVLAITLREWSGFDQYSIVYVLKNTTDLPINEGSFVAFFSDGSAQPQYGFFGTVYPAQPLSRSYTWDVTKGTVIEFVEYDASFFASTLGSGGPVWRHE